VNNDGIDDFAIGAPFYGETAERAGRTIVCSGADWEVLYDFEGSYENGNFGVSLASAGDVNNDGYCDIIVGAPNIFIYDSGPGRAYVYSGFDGSVIYNYIGEEINNTFGLSVCGSFDVDEDGYSDFAIGAPGFDNFKGRAYVYSGKTGDTILTFTGDSAFDEVGRAIAGIGDINQDNYDDLLVGASGWDYHPGKAYVLSGYNGLILFSFHAESDWSRFGCSVASAGDVNKDGYLDFLIGDDDLDTQHGKVYLYSGVDGSLIYSFEGDQTYSGFGFSVASAGDINNDGYGDIAIGAYFERNEHASEVGSVFVYSGLDGSLLRKFFDGGYLSYFGISVAAAGDINADGFDDLIVGAKALYNQENQVGKVYFLTIESCIGSRGDINHDGSDADVMDLTFLIERIFRSGQVPVCSEEADLNFDGTPSNILDLTYLVDFLFRGGLPPRPCNEKIPKNHVTHSLLWDD
jgi:hypothetical protein